ncbi:hypothetical protein [Geothrix sp. PMB-07]|uniref:hypothetical protein n=1 Tax=Geothrix sp. PMB-07 TaxID=3068640 RepID=UPI0027419AA0|nr:hypothetical protein [Geothrix sp. PMB-07]WLT31653.1 hypothetical protein Q9293_18275 [Geothrix sp. PMB-07]
MATIVGRELRRTASVTGNHFFLFTMLLLGTNPRSSVFLLLLVGMVIVFPLSLNPLWSLPRERLLLLPLKRSETMRLRVLPILMSPVVWVILLLPLWGGWRYGRVSATLLLVMVLSNGIAIFWPRHLGLSRWRVMPDWIPNLPGPLGELVQKNLREMLQTLDLYLGVALGLSGALYRLLASRPDPAALHGMSLLVALSFSTYAQRLFGFDAGAGWKRYALLPIKGWQILAAKDVAFLMLLLLLTLPLNLLSGLAAGLVLLGFGHAPSVLDPQAQPPWRFLSGARGWSGFLQVLVMFGAGTAVFRAAPWVILPCAVGYAVSLLYFGAQLDRRLVFSTG